MHGAAPLHPLSGWMRNLPATSALPDVPTKSNDRAKRNGGFDPTAGRAPRSFTWRPPEKTVNPKGQPSHGDGGKPNRSTSMGNPKGKQSHGDGGKPNRSTPTTHQPVPSKLLAASKGKSVSSELLATSKGKPSHGGDRVDKGSLLSGVPVDQGSSRSRTSVDQSRFRSGNSVDRRGACLLDKDDDKTLPDKIRQQKKGERINRTSGGVGKNDFGSRAREEKDTKSMTKPKRNWWRRMFFGYL